ncbi:MAG: glycosyltransferase, partial [Phycisphaerales bacterium]|nr:glycosyltransferase [Phycisphaerales bacterium]
RMRVSVVIPAYNASSLLGETLDSVSAQLRAPDEVIVVDDGSVDDTARIAAAHPVVTNVVRRTNGGIAAARNDGIEAATGDLLFLLDADDLWHPIYLERMVQSMSSNPSAISGFSRFSCFCHPAESPDPFEDVIDSALIRHDAHGFSGAANAGIPILPSFFCARLNALRRLGDRPYIDGHLGGGEACYLPGMLVAMGPMIEHSGPLGRYRMHAAAVTGDEVDAARTMIPALEDLAREVANRQDLGIDAASRKAIQTYTCDWIRKCARRLGGAGYRAEARRLMAKGVAMGDPRAAGFLAASLVPMLASRRVWVSAWRPESVRRAEGTPFWNPDDASPESTDEVVGRI